MGHAHHRNRFLHDRTATAKRRSRFEGFTLVELIVALSVLAVLLAIVLPVLSGIRSGARESGCLMNARQTGIDFFSYAASHDDLVPAPRRAESSSGSWGSESSQAELGIIQLDDSTTLVLYANVIGLWPALLVDRSDELMDHWTCFSVRSAEDHLVHPAASTGSSFRSGHVLPSTYAYSSSFLATPNYFTPGATGSGPVGPQRLSSVTHPARKIVLYEDVVVHRLGVPESALHTPNARTLFLMADGHAQARSIHDLSSPLPGYTYYGVLGIDF